MSIRSNPFRCTFPHESNPSAGYCQDTLHVTFIGVELKVVITHSTNSTKLSTAKNWVYLIKLMKAFMQGYEKGDVFA